MNLLEMRKRKKQIDIVQPKILRKEKLIRYKIIITSCLSLSENIRKEIKISLEVLKA